jgi:microcompartment protein CcmL/EutN
LLEVGNLTPALIVADRAAKAAGVTIVGIESADSAAQCIKLAGSADDVREAGEAGLRLAQQMGATAELVILPGPRRETVNLARQKPVYNPLLGIYDARVPREDAMSTQEAIGLLETQGLVAALHATDEMLKGAAVKLLGKEKIGAAYVTIIVRGDVAAVQAAIATGRQTVERLGGKLILADVIARPHPDLAALLPAGV